MTFSVGTMFLESVWPDNLSRVRTRTDLVSRSLTKMGQQSSGLLMASALPNEKTTFLQAEKIIRSVLLGLEYVAFAIQL
jgi:hypothetical protein